MHESERVAVRPDEGPHPPHRASGDRQRTTAEECAQRRALEVHAEYGGIAQRRTLRRRQTVELTRDHPLDGVREDVDGVLDGRFLQQTTQEQRISPRTP